MARAALSHLDLCFVVDCTNSMAPFIKAAQQQTQHILSTLASQAGADLNVAVVGYRDHGHTGELLDVVPFTPASGKKGNAVTKALKALKAGATNNPDAAEAVYDGLVAACELKWREGALRVLVLVGDAPPHGCGANKAPWPDRFKKCPTGQTTKTMTAFLAEQGIALFALAMLPSSLTQYDAVTEKAFTALATGTEGMFRRATDADGAMDVLQEIARRAFGDLELDRRVALAIEEGEDVTVRPGAPSPMAGVEASEVQASIARLKRRKLVD